MAPDPTIRVDAGRASLVQALGGKGKPEDRQPKPEAAGGRPGLAQSQLAYPCARSWYEELRSTAMRSKVVMDRRRTKR